MINTRGQFPNKNKFYYYYFLLASIYFGMIHSKSLSQGGLYPKQRNQMSSQVILINSNLHFSVSKTWPLLCNPGIVAVCQRMGIPTPLEELMLPRPGCLFQGANIAKSTIQVVMNLLFGLTKVFRIAMWDISKSSMTTGC